MPEKRSTDTATAAMGERQAGPPAKGIDTGEGMMRASEPKKPQKGEPRRRNERREQTQKPEHEGGTENQVGDRTGPGAGYDDRSERIRKVPDR